MKAEFGVEPHLSSCNYYLTQRSQCSTEGTSITWLSERQAKDTPTATEGWPFWSCLWHQMFPETHVARKLLPHPHQWGQGLKKFVCHPQESDNPRVQIGQLSDGVYQHFEILSHVGQLDSRGLNYPNSWQSQKLDKEELGIHGVLFYPLSFNPRKGKLPWTSNILPSCYLICLALKRKVWCH